MLHIARSCCGGREHYLFFRHDEVQEICVMVLRLLTAAFALGV